MKKLRKTIALIAAMVMSLSLIPQTALGTELIPTYTEAYEDYFEGWVRDDAISPNGTSVFTCVTNERAHDGNKSVVIRHTSSGGKTSIVQRNLSLGAGTYRLSFWATCTEGDLALAQARVNPGWIGAGLSSATVAQTDGIWSKYTMDLTIPPTGPTATELHILTDGQTDALYIDEISLVKSGETEDLIKNGSFEGEEEVVPTPTYTAVYEEDFAGWNQWYAGAKNENTYFTCVTNKIAHGGSNSAVLRHTNSSVNDNIYVVQENLSLPAGTYTVTFWAAGTGTKQFVNLQGQEWLNNRLENFTAVETDGIWSKYELNFTVPAGKTNNTIVFGTEVGTEGWYIDDISLVRQGTTQNLLKNTGFEGEEETVPTPTYTTEYEDYFHGWEREHNVTENESTIFSCVTNGFAHSGSNSAVLRHVDTSQNDRDLVIKQPGLSLGQGRYTLSFWAAGTVADTDNDTYRHQHIVWLEGLDPSYRYFTDMTTGTADGDWSYYTLDFTVPAGSTVSAIKLSTRGYGTKYLYIDDINLVAQGTTDNLLTNGGFEETAAGEVEEVPETPVYTEAYEDYFEGWVRDDAIRPNGTSVFTCVTNELAHDGNKSVVIRHTSSGGKTSIVQRELSLGAGTYRLSFWAACTEGDLALAQARVNPGWVGNALTTATVAETDGIWSKYTMDLTIPPTGPTATELHILTDGQTDALFIDEISLVKSGETEDLIRNGSFEGEETEPDAPTYTTEYEDYFHGWERDDAVTQNQSTVFSCVSNEIAHGGSNSVLLRHVDESQNDTDLMIKQTGLSLGEGTYTLSFWAAGTVADTDDDTYRHQHIVWLEGLDPSYRYFTDMTTGTTDGDWSYYTLDFTVPSGLTVSAVKLSTRGYGTEGLYIDDLNLVAQGTTDNLLTNGGFEEKAEGDGGDINVPDGATYTSEYEDYFEGWGNWSAAELDNVNTFYCVTNEIAHSGSNSVVIRHTAPDKSWQAVTIAQEGLSYGAGTYTLSFWAAGNYADNLCGMSSNGDWWDDFYLTEFTAVETDGDWTKYTIDFTVPEGKAQNAITLMSNGDTQGLYLDDISFVKSGETENLISNGSFEEKAEDEEPEQPETPTYTTEHDDYFHGWEREYNATENETTIFSCVTNEIAHSGSNSVLLRHVDESQNDTDLMIKQTGLSLGEGTYTLSFWAAGTVADTDDDTYRYQHIVWLEGLDPSYRYFTDMTTGTTDGDWSYYTLDFTVPSGSTVSAVKLSTRGYGTEGLYIDDFNLVAQGTTDNLLTNGGFEEKAEDDGGDSDVSLVASYTSAYEEYLIGWSRWDAATPDKNLTFSCVTNEISHSGSNSIVLRHADSSQEMKNICLAQDTLSLEAGTYKLSFWAVGTRTDIDMQGVTLADPWRKYSIQDLQAVETDGIWSKYEIEVTMEGTESTMTFVADGDTEGWYIDDISLVKSGEEENLIKNGGFEEKDPSVPDGDVVEEVVLKKNGQRTAVLTGAGEYSVTLVVNNSAIDTILDVEQFVAIYDEDGVLYNNVYSTSASIEKATADGMFTKIETEFDLPEGNFTVEYFVYDGRDTLNIIGSPNPHRIFE